MDAKQRTKYRAELVGLGYKFEYVDNWQPKIDLFWHTPQRNTEGDIVKETGTIMKNVPGNPHYVADKARIGLLPWRPNETCQCKSCRETYGTVRTGEKVMAPTDITKIASSKLFEDVTLVKCDKCDYVQTKGDTQMNKDAGLRLHMRKHRY
jgi:hypothetical protein